MNGKTKKQKTLTAVTAVVLAAAILLTGTFAWQSISQTALNEAQDVVNPGGRLHDDYNGTNKDIYVENFTDPAAGGTVIYARVRLYEYMEIGTGAGLKKGEAGYDDKDVTPIITTDADGDGQPDANIDDVKTWQVYNPGTAETDAFREYWDWYFGGSTVYMPTFNKNKDSLEADINGTWDGTSLTDDIHFDDYREYDSGDTKIDDAKYDADADTDDEGAAAILGTDYRVVDDEEHTAKFTLSASVMTMDEWLAAGAQPGPYWVMDEDGWAYWAQGIQPGTATGMLLDGIQEKEVLSDGWYYGIHAVGQFITAEDMGNTENGTGFYDSSEGSEPSDKALALLTAIGVETGLGPVYQQIIDTIEPGSTDTVFMDGIEFYVLAKDETDENNEKALLLSKYILENRPFDADSNRWAGSDMQLYLNGEFLADKPELNQYTVPTAITTREDVDVSDFDTTIDRVFLLSEADVAGALAGDSATVDAQDYTYNGAMLPAPGSVAVTRSTGEWAAVHIETGVLDHWFLRSPYVVDHGIANYDSNRNMIGSANNVNDIPGIRPAMWVSLEADYVTPDPAHAETIDTIEEGSLDTVTIDGIEFYVLAKESDKALLLAKDLQEARTFDADANAWSGSEMQTYLNGEWLNQYNVLKQYAIPTTLKTRASYDPANTDYTVTTDRIFLLSEADVYGTQGGTEKPALDDDYTISGTQLFTAGDSRFAIDNAGTSDWWWLRSPCNADNRVSAVHNNATAINALVTNATGSIRPALWISLSGTYTGVQAPDHIETISGITAGSTDTVTIDNIEYYVLAKDAAKNQALLLSKDILEVSAFDDDDNVWSGSDMQTYLNETWLNKQSTLQQYAVPTTLYTRQEFDAEDATATTDRVFLLSEADVYGTQNGATAQADDYTISGTQLTPPAATGLQPVAMAGGGCARHVTKPAACATSTTMPVSATPVTTSRPAASAPQYGSAWRTTMSRPLSLTTSRPSTPSPQAAPIPSPSTALTSTCSPKMRQRTRRCC